MKKSLILMSIFALTSGLMAMEAEVKEENVVDSCERSDLASSVATELDGTIMVTVNGGDAPYTVEVAGQYDQVGSGPIFIFTDVEVDEPSIEVKVTDSAACERISNIELP